ncbi:MAG: hypothetical protein JWR48_5798 [Mycobacterium sp.]|jgi:hypothetical protein|nr:hypothetical protein [Mycobacterium sp.]MCW2629076.1 hypothetical protein [Mycobacterium sp.]
MWMVVKVSGTEVLRDVLDRWKASIDAQLPERVAEVFTEDAIFQGLHPYSVGRQGVIDYYASQPPGMTVTYRILEGRQPAAGLVLGYVAADFSFPDRPTVRVYLGVLVKHTDDGWRIVHYQASKLD